MRRARYYEDAFFPIRTINGVWWMLRGRIGLLPTRWCLSGYIGPRNGRVTLLNSPRRMAFKFDRRQRSLTFRISL